MTKNKEITNKVLRYPRPLGLTFAMIHHHKNKENEPELLLKTKRVIIDQWIAGNMRLNGEVYGQEQIGRYLQLDTKLVMKYMWESMGKLGKVIGSKDAGEIARVIFSRALKNGLEIGAHLEHQVHILEAAQGGEYKAFVSATVNQALANWNASQTSTLALLKVLTDKHETNIIINNHSASAIAQHVTSDQALKIINNTQPSMLEDPHLADNQVAKYRQVGLLPDINPNTQNLAQITAPKHFLVHQSDTHPIPTSHTSHTSNPKPNPAHPTHSNRREKKEHIIDLIEDEDEFKA